MVERSELILGCTGRNSLRDINWSNIVGEKLFASLSSNDAEFSSLLKRLKPETNLPETNYIGKIGRAEISVLFGGYPINLDHRQARRDPTDIDPTRALTLLSAIFLVLK